MLRLIGTAAVALLFLSATASATPEGASESAAVGSSRIRVEVTSVAADRTARRLASAVATEIRSDSRFTLAERGSPHVVTISLPARLGWQRRLDRTELSYQARLTLPNGHSRIVAGHCWNWALKACAKQIVDAAAQLRA
jgi:hypothetical protein